MSAAAAILDGMPDARDLHRLDSGGQTAVSAGSVQLFRYPEADTAARNVAVAALRQLGFGGADVAAVMGLTPNYVSTLYQRSLREGTAALSRPVGWPRQTGEASWEQARAWRADGVRDAEIARRLGVNQATVLRRLGPAHVQAPLPPGPQARQPGPEPAEAEPEGAPPEGAPPETAARPAAVTVSSRYAGSMLLHAFFARSAAGTVLAVPSSATNPTRAEGSAAVMPSTCAAPPPRMRASTSWTAFTSASLPAAAVTSSPSSSMAARTASASRSATMPRNTPPDRSCSGVPGPMTTAVRRSRSSRGTGAPVAAYSQAWS